MQLPFGCKIFVCGIEKTISDSRSFSKIFPEENRIATFLKLFSIFGLKCKKNVDKFFCLRKFKNYKLVS